MNSIAAQLASIISLIVSGEITTLAGSPNMVGEEFKKLLDALRAELKGISPRDVIRKVRPLVREFSPIVVYTIALILLIGTAFVDLIYWLFHRGWRENLQNLALWTLLLGILISCLPLISRLVLRRWLRPLALVAAETVVLAAALSIFATLAVKLPLHHLWTLYTAGLIGLLAGGGRWVELVQAQTENALLREWSNPDLPTTSGGPSRQDVSKQLGSIKQYFRWELITYSALPLGVPIGLFFGLRYGNTPVEIIAVCLRWVFGLACVFLLYFLSTSCRRMSHPYLDLAPMPTAKLEDGSDAARDWGCVFTEYRKMFLADTIENAALLITFFLLTWLLRGTHTLPVIDAKFLGAVVAGSIILNQLPYLIGQWRVQDALVRPFQGWTKITKTKEATENIPLVPKLEWIAALIGEASAGGLAIELMKKIAELTGKP
jgi:hypothetical protein